MPTPSPNQPPDQPPSASPYSFSTCPDDILHTTRHDLDNHSGPALDGLSPANLGLESQGLMHRTVETATDNRASESPSSRDTTVSPAPQTSTTAVTSPESRGIDAGHTMKNPELGPDGPTPHTASARPSQSLEQPPKDLGGPDLAMFEEEDAACTPPSMGSDYSSARAIPFAPLSFLQPGSRFHGTQQSERQVYDVQVEIKHVDMRESFLCGYLRIQGLTEDHPTLTTYFEGEIIGSKYSFFTQHEDWGANMKVDLSHWAKFNAFRPFQKHARKGPVTIPDVTQRENIFMRWKEHFLVPDHRVRTITGASFEGFYYICFNQLKGEVSGIYFHSKSEKFQQLELKHVPNRGCFSATEFR
ncbi:vacuolar import and degradation family protein [Metarhizium robertsii]|uniref:Vesicle-mediated transport protein Vid24 n=2 Tax=Metarhizium robertsii TaxID=568076 RepID=E9ELT5_METRA|nr:vesicle-mediated transport protein Vid24 [Metarhizium robertsii ARSEF 23]EFZ03194.2 vesicle-mediated transport protein Vid24 [Metarhizium robertsii ARSEF 23]EXV01131.1 vacuolar import and degradation family protein [Metarhizium robertsii]